MDFFEIIEKERKGRTASPGPGSTSRSSQVRRRGPSHRALFKWCINPSINIYIKILKRFYMDKSHHLSSPMVVRSLEVTKDPFWPKEENEEFLGPEVQYLSAIGTLMYLANNTRPDIAFSINLLARYSLAQT